ncbi:hypothetical protein J437_LFUL002724 [Ladona fulva]|uniref:Uncharacterized protein n=1 Tax=Ladona fulva TaxID=123851 RepID=A0A8K0K0Y1_LADFU|nr:hypothetical protein J437_LFUL002724 [Ladona fulva]
MATLVSRVCRESRQVPKRQAPQVYWFCYIELADEETANKVREELHQKEYGKWKLYVFKKRIGKRVKKRFPATS